MTDMFAPEKRSEIMKKVRGKDTELEMKVRRLVHGMGYRYRLHVGKLPGRPDLVFPALRKVVFIHGCFWHRHSCRAGNSTPTSRANYWLRKFERNQKRDAGNIKDLKRTGWRVLVIWECMTKDPKKLRTKLMRYLGPRSQNLESKVKG